MILAEDAIAGGNMLLPKGGTITDRHITIFRQWGLQEADVEGICDTDSSGNLLKNISPDILDKAKKKVVPRFKHADIGFTPVKELCKLCIVRKARALQKKAKGA